MLLLQALLLCTSLAIVSPEARAADVKIATVDLNRAMQEVDDGKSALARLETIAAGKQAEITQMEESLMSLKQEFDSKVSLLSEASKEDYKKRLYEGQMQLQQAVMIAEQEYAMAQQQAMQQLLGKMKTVAESIAGEQGYNIVLESSQGIVVWAEPASDITDELIRRYNEAN